MKFKKKRQELKRRFRVSWAIRKKFDANYIKKKKQNCGKI